MKELRLLLAIFAVLILIASAGCQGELATDSPLSPHAECVRAIAEAQLRGVAERVGVCAGDSACVESEIQQRALITAQYVEDLCLGN